MLEKYRNIFDGIEPSKLNKDTISLASLKAYLKERGLSLKRHNELDRLVKQLTRNTQYVQWTDFVQVVSGFYHVQINICRRKKYSQEGIVGPTCNSKLETLLRRTDRNL